MRLSKLHENRGQRLRLRPAATQRKAYQIAYADDVWLLTAIGPGDFITLTNTQTQQQVALAADHVHSFTSSSGNDRDTFDGFLELKVRIDLSESVPKVEPILSGAARIAQKETPPPLHAAGTPIGEYPPAPPTPMSPAALFAYANGHPRPNDLTYEIGKRRRIPVERFDSESAYLNEQVTALEIKTIRELDELVRRYASIATRLSDYLSPQGSIDTGFIISLVLDVAVIESSGKAGLIRFHESLRHSTGGAHFAAEIYMHYEEIKTFG